MVILPGQVIVAGSRWYQRFAVAGAADSEQGWSRPGLQRLRDTEALRGLSLRQFLPLDSVTFRSTFYSFGELARVAAVGPPMGVMHRR